MNTASDSGQLAVVNRVEYDPSFWMRSTVSTHNLISSDQSRYRGRNTNLIIVTFPDDDRIFDWNSWTTLRQGLS